MGKRNKLQNSPELSRIEQLPDDILLLILSFLPTLVQIARTSTLSRRWRNIWHNITCLDLSNSTTTALPKTMLKISQESYASWVNKVIDSRIAFPSSTSVKELRFRYELDASHGHHIDRWINFAIANRVETLHLEFSCFWATSAPSDQYELSEKTWCKASGFSSLKCLKSLFLMCVTVSKQFIEFILSNCSLLEDLSLHYAGTYNNLDVTGAPPLRLRKLKIDGVEDFSLNKLCAPHLTSFYYKSRKLNPQKIDVPMLNDLAIGGFFDSQPIMKYLEHFWSYLPQLEKLELIMEEDDEFKLNPFPELVKLKYLKISVDWDTNPFFDQIINFIKASPSLETFVFQSLTGGLLPWPRRRHRRRRKQKWHRMEPSCFNCLKELKLCGGEGKTIDQEIVEFIFDKSPHLEKLIVNITYESAYRDSGFSEPEIVEVVKVKAKRLCRGRPLVEIRVVS